MFKKYNSKETIAEKIKRFLLRYELLDCYATNSLSEMHAHFKEDPPKARNRDGDLAAHVALIYSSIRRTPGIPEETVDLKEDIQFYSRPSLFPGDVPSLKTIAYIPIPVPFQIKTQETLETALWVSGRTKEYQKAQERYNFNEHTFTTVEIVIVEYRHDLSNPKPLLLRDFIYTDMPQRKIVSKKEKAVVINPLLNPGYAY